MPYGQYRIGGTANPDSEPVVVPPNKGRALVWLDASDGTTIVSQSGNEVTEVSDKANGLTYRSDTRAPATGGPDTGTDTIGGLNVFNFSASETLRSHIGSSDPSAFSVYDLNNENCISMAFIGQTNNPSTDGSSRVFTLNAGTLLSSDFKFDVTPGTFTNNRIVPRVNSNNRWNILSAPESLVLGAPYIFCCTLTLPSKNTANTENTIIHKFELNGVGEGYDSTPLNNGDSSADFNDPVEILFGGRPSNNTFSGVLNSITSEKWYGLLGEIILFRGYWSPTELTGYLAHKWSQTGLLPVTHEYKTVAPTLPSFI